ncbi:hypothetical protein G7Y89_g14319 [Cudoniella acicularis]|uniref:Uncharacterized protein n=1 Tax=Cudoniella acicularis TaxID=354080 RepID=A0A8H4VWA5_9HELO|nr:hypothetical protein G7Y89_g14319 [Cudoniella acicularis]
MQIGNEAVIKAYGFLLLSWTASAIVSTNQRRSFLGVDYAPAPSPEDGPAFSAHASRNKALLPYQVIGIVGAYLICVIIVGTALLLIGRRLRQKILLPEIALDVEMVATQKRPYNINTQEISPVANPKSPRNFSYPSPGLDDKTPYVFPNSRSPITPTGIEDPNVDARIAEIDREMAQRDLEDIYAHVMEHEEMKAAGMSPKEMAPLPMPTPAPQRGSTPPKKGEKHRPGNINLDESRSLKSRASSIMSALRSPRSKNSVKSMQISSPLPTPMSASFPNENGASDEEPLSPKYYYKPPPPVPTDQVPYNHSRNNSSIPPQSPTKSIAEQLAPYGPGGPGNSMHRTNPSAASTQSFREEPPSATSQTTTTPLYSPPPRQPSRGASTTTTMHPHPMGSNPPSTNASQRTLPFRAFDPPLASPSFKPATKTTILERTVGANNGPMTSGLKTPWSAGAVPYSPYQPFSPMIPITPRLVTKEDRKAMKKAQKRMPVTELVGSDEEMWDSAY